MSSVKRVVADHPLGAFLVIGYAVALATAVPPLAEIEIWLGRPLYAVLGTIFGVGVAAFLVTAVADGRAAVVDLLRRSFRWRVPVRWYLICLFAVPTATTLLAISIYGGEALVSPAGGWLRLLGILLGAFVLQLILFQLAEEIGWTGFFQERLRSRYGPLKLSAVVAFFWAVWHVPDFFVDEGWGIEQAISAVVLLVIEFVSLFFARVVIVWLYYRTARSVLLVAIFHASFDTTISDLSEELIPAPDAVTFIIVTSVIVLGAVAVIAATKGRFADNNDVVEPGTNPT
jgi:membrane protease YdiL (CAAX protease family)